MKEYKLDLLVIVAHPDDAELACGGVILSHIAQGKKVGVVDLTQGEMGTRGTKETRKSEAKEASEILGLNFRGNLNMPDATFTISQENILSVIKIIRLHQPEIVITNAIEDRHPDHPKAAELVKQACFLSGLSKIVTVAESKNSFTQAAWRPKKLYHMIQANYIKPDLVVDITPYWEKKMQAIRAYKTQFYSAENSDKEVETFISTPRFIHFLEARAREFGQSINVDFAEGFTVNSQIGVRSLFDIC
jgi:bacillithiol biosynthesis deacetylase BshB1